MKLTMNGALTIGTEDGANIEMRESITDEYWPFSFGLKKEDILKMLQDKSYNPREIYSNNAKIKKALDMIKDGSLCENEFEKSALLEIYNMLLNEAQNDKFFVLKDLESFYETQKKVEELYLDKDKWNEFVINNIAGMGQFSSDTVIHNYASSIWGIEKCTINPKIYEKVQRDYYESSICYIPNKDQS